MDDLPDLTSYDLVLVMWSGGKDSLACILHLLEQGVPKSKIELWHHDIDGGSPFMDWPCTPSYCGSIAKHLSVPLYHSWRMGGFLREMLRNGTPTAPTVFERPDGSFGEKGGKGMPGTRQKFPQVSADLSVRWCSAYLKIDVASIAIKNQERFNGIRTLFVTGERAEESSARSRYRVFEPHRTDARAGKFRRHVDHWRAVHAWNEQQVWDIVRAHRINPHPAYRLGWGRVSCLSCIFGSANQWASVRKIAPVQFETIAQYEQQFGKTIQRKRSIVELANKGTAYLATENAALIAEALATQWPGPPVIDPWILPPGAFGESTGPT